MKKILSKLTVFIILLSAFSCSKVELYEPWDEFLEGLESASGGGEDTVRTFGVETVDVGTNTVRLKGTISADIAEEYESYGFFCYENVSFNAPVCDYDAIIVLAGKPKGQILTAYVYDDKYIVNGYVRVGDDKSKIYEMEGDKEEISYDNNGGAIFWRPTGWKDIEFTNCPKFTYDARGVITSIGFWSF